MEPRKPDKDKKAQKLADELKLQELITLFNNSRMDSQIKDIIRKKITASFNNTNKLQVLTTAGNNNTVLVLNTTQFVIMLSELRHTAGNKMKQAFETHGGTPSWFAKEFRIEEVESNAYKIADKQFQKLYEPEYNNFKAGQLAGEYLSVSAVEYFPNSLDKLVKQALPDNQRIKIACDIGKQACALFEDIEKIGYLWSDLKTSNIMLRSDNSIGISDKKRFMSYNDVLVKKLPPYFIQLKKDGDEFNEYEKILAADELIYKKPASTTSPIEFSVRNSNGEIIRGALSDEVLRKKFDNDNEYAEFRNMLETRSIIKEHNKPKIFEACHEQYGTKKGVYIVNTKDYLTEGFVTPEFYNAKQYDDPNMARVEFIQNLKKEYSYQLAAVLYITLTGSEEQYSIKPLSFKNAVFQSPKGQQLQSLIERLGHDDPSKRISYQEALVELNNIQPELTKKASKSFLSTLVKTPRSEKDRHSLESIKFFASPVNPKDKPVKKVSFDTTPTIINPDNTDKPIKPK